MSQFRNTADILDEILQKAGEVTNGNSPYETLALTYANKVHHAIVAGGNIFDLDVDESWTWSRSRYPIIMELKAPVTAGTVSCTNANTTITFTTASSTSLEGWHFQVNGKPTTYKITQHTASNTVAIIDSAFVDSTSTTYTYKAFKLDYTIEPLYIHVDNYNDRIDFQETAATTLSATLTHGTYELTAFATHVATRLGTAGTASYTGTYDTISRQFAITANVTYKLFGSQGPNTHRTALPTLGFALTNQTGAQVYTSSYSPNQIARMIEPFKLFQYASDEPFIYATDPVKMQQDYPIAQTRQRMPNRFTRLSENRDGIIEIRFNAYPKDLTKIQIDWVPQPSDLQDNTVSHVTLPRGDIDTLIHGAAAFIAFDKEDTKFSDLIALCKAGLSAMQKKNRALLMQTGEYFGQIIPREDLERRRKRLNFGYTNDGLE